MDEGSGNHVICGKFGGSGDSSESTSLWEEGRTDLFHVSRGKTLGQRQINYMKLPRKE